MFQTLDKGAEEREVHALLELLPESMDMLRSHVVEAMEARGQEELQARNRRLRDMWTVLDVILENMWEYDVGEELDKELAEVFSRIMKGFDDAGAEVSSEPSRKIVEPFRELSRQEQMLETGHQKIKEPVAAVRFVERNTGRSGKHAEKALAAGEAFLTTRQHLESFMCTCPENSPYLKILRDYFFEDVPHDERQLCSISVIVRRRDGSLMDQEEVKKLNEVLDKAMLEMLGRGTRKPSMSVVTEAPAEEQATHDVVLPQSTGSSCAASGSDSASTGSGCAPDAVTSSTISSSAEPGSLGTSDSSDTDPPLFKSEDPFEEPEVPGTFPWRMPPPPR